MNWLVDIFSTCWAVLGQMAPYLLFGFLMAGILSVLIPAEWVGRHLGGRGIGPVFKAACLGVPLPLCSCSVIPVTASFRNHGASRGATVSFLLSTPQTGVDSILATYALLGPVLAVYRPLVAFFSGIVGGSIAALVDQDPAPAKADGETVNGCTDDCCVKKPGENVLVRAFRYGFVTLPRDISKELLFGIAVAGLISVVVSENYLSAYLGGGIIAMLVMLAAGIPMYVCATASIPIALGFIHMGASPGAALVFLISGPATNAATIAVLWRILGKRTTFIYLMTVALGAIGAGYSLDLLYSVLPTRFSELASHMHEHGISWFGHICAVLLLVVLLSSMLRKIAAVEIPEVKGKPEETTLLFSVHGMTCSHCANTVQQSLQNSKGVRHAQVDLSRAQARVFGEHLDPQALRETIQSLGYESALIEN
ncbi:MAG TPA: SO_0444 family Cu/Zn efflux transporter [Candidatus Hydrogenedentes bacterium]|mgnify:CR=1 FL=1|nr:SO_0444 family Cu/Zn efflux transporter [Candidatus Hydrogenedentota bacterium]